ncbi:hypothetical protein Celaphus_00004837, partial [Cervus elaphus hippelaphus]
MAPENLAIGVIFLSHTMAGIMGSFCPVYHFLSLYFSGGKCQSTDWILKHMIIIPSDSRWAELNRKAPRYVGTFSVLCWIFSMILSILVPLYKTA